jgi:uncharacterized membrane protein
MTITVTQKIHTTAAPLEVWEVMSDVVRWPSWTESVTSVKRLDGGVFGVGSRVAIKQPKFPEAIWNVTKFEAGVGFEWENISPGMRSRGSHHLKPGPDGGTDVELTIRQEGPFARLFGWWLKAIDEKYVRMEIEGLKRHVEDAVHTSAESVTPESR